MLYIMGFSNKYQLSVYDFLAKIIIGTIFSPCDYFINVSSDDDIYDKLTYALCHDKHK